MSELTLVRFGLGEAAPTDYGGKGSCVAQLPLIVRGITITIEGAIRNELTRGDLGGLGNLAKFGRIRIIMRNSNCRWALVQRQ